MLALRETFRVFTINAFFIFERPFVFAGAGAGAGAGFGWHMDALMDIYIQRKKLLVGIFVGFIQGTLTGDSVPRYPPTGDSVPRYPPTGELRPPLTPYRGTLSPVNPLQGNSVPR